ncbi:MAG: glutaredoxin domain-containing protein, partial [Bacillota bacterium]
MKFKVYYKLNCPKCRLTIAQLKQLPVKVSKIYVDTTDSSKDSVLNQLRQAGYKSFPVVKVYNTSNQLVDVWSDFRADKINE